MLKTPNPITPRDEAQATHPQTTEALIHCASISPEAAITALSQFDFVTKYEISRLTGLAPATLKHYRLSGRLKEGIHWVKLNPRVIRYNRLLVRDWIQNQDKPHLHQRAIESYLRSLLSYEKKNKKR
jgi:hypothetical protein